MSENAAKVLEGAAQKYASEAIRFDSQGARGMAIKNYQNAIQTLVQLAQLYPDYKLNSMYLQRAQLYQERIKALQAAHGIEPPPEDDSSSGFNFQPPPARSANPVRHQLHSLQARTMIRTVRRSSSSSKRITTTSS